MLFHISKNCRNINLHFLRSSVFWKKLWCEFNKIITVNGVITFQPKYLKHSLLNLCIVRASLLVSGHRRPFVICNFINYLCMLKVTIMHIITFSLLELGLGVVDTRLGMRTRLVRESRAGASRQLFIQILWKFKESDRTHILRRSQLLILKRDSTHDIT